MVGSDDAKSHHELIADDPVCYRPRYLHNVPVSEVQPFDFTCDHDYYDYYYDTDYDQVDSADYDDELHHYDTAGDVATHNNDNNSSAAEI